MKAGYCAVCSDERRAEFDRAHIGGMSIRELAKQFGRNKDTVQRHVKHHIVAATQRAVAVAHVREAEQGDSILAEVNDLRDEARRLQRGAEAKHDYRTAIAAIRELTRLVELKARVLGELRDREISVTNVQINAETAERMATMFLARRSSIGASKPEPVSVDSEPSASIDVEAVPNGK